MWYYIYIDKEIDYQFNPDYTKEYPRFININLLLNDHLLWILMNLRKIQILLSIFDTS